MQIFYQKKLSDHNLKELEESLSNSKIQIAALVVDKVDKIIHGMELGSAGMNNQVQQWINEGYLGRLIQMLHHNGNVFNFAIEIVIFYALFLFYFSTMDTL